jgi:hypothetical protein
MATNRKGDIDMVLVVIGSIVLLLITIGIFISGMWPAIRYGPFSPCYARAVSDTDSLSTFNLIREPQTISLGDCVNAMYFVNDDFLSQVSDRIGKDFKEQVDCDPGGRSYIITVPKLLETEYGWNIFKWPKTLLNNFKEKLMGSVGGKAYCNILSRETYYKSSVAFRGSNLNEKNNVYCVDIAKDKDTNKYVVYHCEGTCEQCGPNPLNPSIFDDTTKPSGNWKESGSIVGGAT